MLRLVFAFAVLVSHAYPLAGLGDRLRWEGENLGGWAVIGFFVVSGYLITGSRLRSPAGAYLVHRIARIFPAFWVCLLAVAFAFAPIGYWHQHGTLDGFLTTANPPANFVFENALLRIFDYSVAGTLTDVPA